MLSYFVVHDPFGAVQAFSRHLYMCTFAKLQLSPLNIADSIIRKTDVH